MFTWIGAGLLCAIALAHSVYGERDVVQPLCEAPWQLQQTPRWAAKRLIRLVWHMTSVAWLCLAAALLGLDAHSAVALCAAASALGLFVVLRGHAAWPLLGGVAVLALRGRGELPGEGVMAVMALAIAVSVAAGAVHVYWALGGRWGVEAALPQGSSGRRFEPPAWLTMVVAAALWTLAALMAAALAWPPQMLVKAPLLGAALLLTLRAVGDGAQVGLSKRDRSTRFARMDDALYTPLVILLAAGSAGAWLL